jgi:acetyltransferase-like isoleucine patch superfamily enzyme
MTGMAADRSLPWDWYPGTVPANVNVADSAYVETTYSFALFRSERPDAAAIGQGASMYLGTMFDVGRQGRVTVGDYTLLNGARIMCEREITIEAFVFISWNVVLMDSYRMPFEPEARRTLTRQVPDQSPRGIAATAAAAPIRIERAAWIGFDTCILPGVTIGQGAVVGARSVVAADVPPFTIVAGNPARPLRRLTEEEIANGR